MGGMKHRDSTRACHSQSNIAASCPNCDLFSPSLDLCRGFCVRRWAGSADSGATYVTRRDLPVGLTALLAAVCTTGDTLARAPTRAQSSAHVTEACCDPACVRHIGGSGTTKQERPPLPRAGKNKSGACLFLRLQLCPTAVRCSPQCWQVLCGRGLAWQPNLDS